MYTAVAGWVKTTLMVIVQQICVNYHKNCVFGGKSTKIGADHAKYTWIDFSYSAKPDF